ncbi:TSUP family transporter [Methylomonas montana]|uniref:TSUP family transporter n=1 Tax=Methylomonas montana TaxID=3058963 RepID=UPI00265A09B0|nr:TSUP family transporter [Methylomonas montana]WKJ90319.1 TSUP family transporter [Methylomonas montana]
MSITGMATSMFAAAVILAAMMFVGAWFGAYLANHISGPHLRLMFGIFICCLGVYLIYGALKRLGWLYRI